MSNQQVIDYARFVGTLGTGVATGLLLGIPLLSFHAVDAVTLSQSQRLIFWKATYTRAKAFVPLMLGGSSLAFLLAAYTSSGTAFTNARSLYLFEQRVCSRAQVFALIGALNMGVIGYTFGVMSGLMNKMLDAAVRPESNAKIDTDVYIRQWLNMHNSRIAMVSAAFVLSVTELIAF